ncbi:MAG: hypothetical protein Q9183_005692 [Haloplaca sp. 2 TL-2023]
MQEIYNIRCARRRENAERAERRRQRHEARAAGDWARVEQLRIQAQIAASAREAGGSMDSPRSSSTSLPYERSASAMLAEHQARTKSRDRRVSSVSYAELGLARHDGSRIRADSVESDHRPLLDSAASMGGSRRGSLFTIPPRPGQHGRNASTGSVLTTGSDSENGPIDTPYTSNRRGSDPTVLTPSATQGSSGSDREDAHPTEDPPRYEDEEAPPYTSPVRTRGATIPDLTTVPSIEVEVPTPANSVPATPVEQPTAQR